MSEPPYPLATPPAHGAPESHADWLRRARAGEKEAFEPLVEAYQARCFRMAWRMTGDRQAAEELVQEAFLRAYRALPAFREGEPFGPWLNTILTHLCLNYVERRRHAPVPVPDRDVTDTQSGAPAVDQVTDTGAGPDEQAAAHELEHDLVAEIDALPARYKAAFVMRHSEGFSVAQIARTLAVPEGTVKTLLFRARERLRRRLRRHL